MSIDPKIAITDIDAVLAHKPEGSGHGAVSELTAMFQACIERWAPLGSSYRTLADRVAAMTTKDIHAGDQLWGILRTLRRDYEKGMIKTFEEIVHASMFDDLLGQAQGLVDGNYLLAATVVGGATLESHLRQLATKHQIPTADQKNNKTVPRSASALNDDLHAKAKAYSTTEWTQVQAWIHLRNEAAHGRPEFQNRTTHDVGSMINGIREFMMRNPA